MTGQIKTAFRGVARCRRHPRPVAPTWDLYHPITGRLNEIRHMLIDARAAEAGTVGRNRKLIRELLESIRLELAHPQWDKY